MAMRLVARIAGLCVVGLLSNSAQAQSLYPNKPIHFVVGFPAGSGADILCRFIATKVGELSKSTIVIDNKPGANGNLAPSVVAKAKPDGYTVLMSSSSNMVFTRFMFKGLSHDTVKDFTPVASFALTSFIFTVGIDSGINTLDELTAHLKKAKQPKYGYNNQTNLIGTEWYKQIIGVDMAKVGYRSAPDAMPDVQNGSLDFMIMDGPFAAGIIKQGKLRGLAVTTPSRIAMLPDIPTAEQAGLKGYDVSPWWGVYVPVGTSQGIVDQLGKWINEATAMPETEKFMATVAGLPLVEDGKQNAARIQSNLQSWGPIFKAAKIEPQELQ